MAEGDMRKRGMGPPTGTMETPGATGGGAVSWLRRKRAVIARRGDDTREREDATPDRAGRDDASGGRQVRFTVASEQSGLRLDLFLTAREIGLSRTQIGRAVDEGQVQVNGRPGRAGRKLKTGDVVDIVLPAARPSGVIPEAIPLKILYEDASLLVIDKPAGMVVHPAAGHLGGTLVNALLHHCRDLSGIGGVLRPGSSTVSTRRPPDCWWSPNPMRPTGGWPGSSNATR